MLRGTGTGFVRCRNWWIVVDHQRVQLGESEHSDWSRTQRCGVSIDEHVLRRRGLVDCDRSRLGYHGCRCVLDVANAAARDWLSRRCGLHVNAELPCRRSRTRSSGPPTAAGPGLPSHFPSASSGLPPSTAWLATAPALVTPSGRQAAAPLLRREAVVECGRA